jgi:hypothetical protein
MMTAVRTGATVAALALVATGCARADAAESAAQGTATGSVQQLTTAAGRGIHLDFTPLTSPRDAVGKGDLIVQGTLVQVSDGIQVRYPDEALTQRERDYYVTFVVAVDKVLDGDAGAVSGGKVHLAVPKSSGVTSKELAALNPQAKVVAVLDDITTWKPVPGATVVRPSAIPADARLYAPYRDGMWLQGSQDDRMLAIDSEHAELAPAWGGVRTVSDYAGVLERAAQGR